MAEEVKTHFTEEHTQMANTHMKRHSASLAFGEMQMETTEITAHLFQQLVLYAQYPHTQP